MDASTLCQAMPGLPSALAAQYLEPMQAAMRQFNITSELRARMWLAQVGHESNSLRYLEELASGAAYEGRQDLGNTQAGDGVKYKGRGPIQITGRTNYTAAGNALDLDLVNHPELAADPQYAFLVSAWWWGAHGINVYADHGDVVGATHVINGGENGLSDREYRYTLAANLGAAVAVEPGEEDWMPFISNQNDFDDAMDAWAKKAFPKQGALTDVIARRAASTSYARFGYSLLQHSVAQGSKLSLILQHFKIKIPGGK